jgi:hypothetical protein
MSSTAFSLYTFIIYILSCLCSLFLVSYCQMTPELLPAQLPKFELLFDVHDSLRPASYIRSIVDKIVKRLPAGAFSSVTLPWRHRIMSYHIMFLSPSHLSSLHHLLDIRRCTSSIRLDFTLAFIFIALLDLLIRSLPSFSVLGGSLASGG